MPHIRFRFAVDKAKAALHKMVCDQPGIDLHAMLKTCYFADKSHLHQYARPIFGATYRAMRFGPVPLEIYEMAKSEPLWLSETGDTEFPWSLDGFRLLLRHPKQNDCAPDLGHLSETDINALELAHEQARSMNFNQRTSATHQQDWQKAKLGFMKYEDMLHGAPDYEEKLKYLQENAHKIRL